MLHIDIAVATRVVRATCRRAEVPITLRPRLTVRVMGVLEAIYMCNCSPGWKEGGLARHDPGSRQRTHTH